MEAVADGKLDPFCIDLSRIESDLLGEELATVHESTTDESQKHSATPNAEENGKLLDSLADLFNNYFNPVIPVAPSDVAPAPGGTRALDALLRGICEPGDGILVPGPCWNGFESGSWAHSSIQPVVANVPSFKDTFTSNIILALAQAMDQSGCRIKALFLTNPHIPLGQCYPLEVLQACMRFCNQRNIHFVTDETYALTSFQSADIADPVPFISSLSLDTRALGCDQSRLHTLWSISKDFGASGFNMACTITQGNSKLVARLEEASTSQIPAASTAFTSAFLSSPNLPFLIAMNSARLAESYIMVTSFFLRHDIKYIPANSGLSILAKLAPRAKTWDDERAMVARLREAGVLVSAGALYHSVQQERGWARLSFSAEKHQLQEALQRIENALGYTS